MLSAVLLSRLVDNGMVVLIKVLLVVFSSNIVGKVDVTLIGMVVNDPLLMVEVLMLLEIPTTLVIFFGTTDVFDVVALQTGNKGADVITELVVEFFSVNVDTISQGIFRTSNFPLSVILKLQVASALGV